MNFLEPWLLNFKSLGSQEIGYLSVAENQKEIPFDLQRVFWTYETPSSVVRGHHAHLNTKMVLIALSGKIKVHTLMPNHKELDFVLESPKVGLFMPALCWHTMEYSENAVQLVLASCQYDEADYIREYDIYRNFMQQKK